MQTNEQNARNPVNRDTFTLRGGQQTAAEVRGRDVIVTAGAGSGKTRTLVARYLSLLEEGFSPREILAVTFTEKAAREMRNRIRSAVRERAGAAQDLLASSFWFDLEAGMDAARIGTVHSFCSEVLHWHPAEAGLDPEFEVIEEGLSAMLRIQSVDSALAWAVDDPDAAPIFASFSIASLQRLLVSLLSRRLDVTALLDPAKPAGREAVRRAVREFATSPRALNPIEEIRGMQAGRTLADDAGELLAVQLDDLLACWDTVIEALAAGRIVDAAAGLFRMRREFMRLDRGRKTSRARESLEALRTFYDETVNPWLGGSKSSDRPPDQDTEDRFDADLGRITLLFERAVGDYRGILSERRSLDFDDLEEKSLALLGIPSIRRRWQDELKVVLVDEFQDSNERQRDIVAALSGRIPGHLFVVGDARQSIYRFRGADVTVFRKEGDSIRARGGESVELDITYRAHASLLRLLDRLLPPVMGSETSPGRIYQVPYSPMIAYRDEARPGVKPPFVEFILGGGENSEQARPHAAMALVQRLLALREEGEIDSWEDVALLFRASTGFSAYEDALEALNVPFVTVAGRGFYERPEIRDVLNILRALADPWDDLALAGLLRSPAFGLTDAALYSLRWGEDGARSLRTALTGDLSYLNESDRVAAERAVTILDELEPLTDRLPVAELLKRTLDLTDYRAILAGAHHRYWRNVDKLLNDAHTSRLVRVRSFLEYIRTARDVGVREGEAPVEADGAVRLMTIHKAKGLEFPFVVLADASRRIRKTGEAIYLLPETGLAFRPSRLEAQPIVYGLALVLDRQREEAEESRLLYVAATRAREKLIISGHCTARADGWRTDGWMKALAEAAGMEPSEILGTPGSMQMIDLGEGEVVGAWAATDEVIAEPALADMAPVPWPVSRATPLFHPPQTVDAHPVLEEGEEPPREWRATGERVHPPAAVVGLMVHKALEVWLSAGDKELDQLLEIAALDAGLANPEQRGKAVGLARSLLDRLKNHPIWHEIESASERFAELPYAYKHPGGGVETGVIDLLYGGEAGWVVVDYKADEIKDETELAEAVDGHRPQVEKYLRACQTLLEGRVEGRLCFLDAMGEVMVVAV